MTPKDNSLYSTSQIRQMERLAVNRHDVTEIELMKRAGQAAFSVLKKRFPHVEHIAVFCGGGNNGGDGYVFAYLAKQAGFSVIIYHDNTIQNLPDAAQQAAAQALSSDIPCQPIDDGLDSEVELIVDAMLGIGLQGTVRNPLKSVIEFINDQDLPVMSLDIPSGLEADTGQMLGSCVKAQVTVTFIAAKTGLYTLDGPDCSGEIIIDNLQLHSVEKAITPAAIQINQHQFNQLIKPRKKNVHKGLFGHVLVVGGGQGMPGASCLAAMAAMRVGCGSLTLATYPEYAKQPIAGLPEAMVYGVEDADGLKSLLQKATVCIIGPGLGESEWATQLFAVAIGSQIPLVIDASAIHLLAKEHQQDDNWILTPHPGEAARLLDITPIEVQTNRLEATQRIQQKYGGCVVLKGVGTIVDIGAPSRYICPAGNPGMSSAGMGDVLSGVIGSLVAQGLTLAQAAQLGVWLHAKAGDDAVAKHGQRGLLASDLLPYLRKRMNILN